MSGARKAFTLRDLAEATPFSEDTFRRAIAETDPRKFPHPMRAKKDSRGRLIVLEPELDRWLGLLPDA